MVGVLNGLFLAIGSIIGFFIDLLPNSPFLFFENLDLSWMHFINWIFPIPTFITILNSYLVASITYYFVRIVLRWLKVVGT